MSSFSEHIAYRDGRIRLTGTMYRSETSRKSARKSAQESAQESAAGLLLVHGGAGLDDHARDQAQRWAALALARSGEAIDGAVSIHGSLATPAPARPNAVRARVLVCHGASDPHVPMADVVSFTSEMADAGADWQLTMYGGALHGFTHRHAEPGATPGVAYDERADRRSFADASRFLAEALL